MSYELIKDLVPFPWDSNSHQAASTYAAKVNPEKREGTGLFKLRNAMNLLNDIGFKFGTIVPPPSAKGLKN